MIYQFSTIIDDYRIYQNIAELFLTWGKEIKNNLQVVSNIIHRQAYYNFFNKNTATENSKVSGVKDVEFELFKKSVDSLHKKFYPNLFAKYLWLVEKSKKNKEPTDFLKVLKEDKYARYLYINLINTYDIMTLKDIDEKIESDSDIYDRLFWDHTEIPELKNWFLEIDKERKNVFFKQLSDFITVFFDATDIEAIWTTYVWTLVSFLKTNTEDNIIYKKHLIGMNLSLIKSGNSITDLYDQLIKKWIKDAGVPTIMVAKKLGEIFEKEEMNKIIKHININKV
jgi:hypothetical protein